MVPAWDSARGLALVTELCRAPAEAGSGLAPVQGQGGELDWVAGSAADLGTQEQVQDSDRELQELALECQELESEWGSGSGLVPLALQGLGPECPVLVEPVELKG